MTFLINCLFHVTFLQFCNCLLIKSIFSKSKLRLRSCPRLLVAPDELYMDYYTHRVISDKVHRLLVTLSYFRSDRFVQLLTLILTLILLFHLLVSIVYTGLCELFSRRRTTVF